MKIKNIEYKALRAIESNKNLTQRELAKSLDISLGKANYIIKAFVSRGWIKLDNFRKSDNKIGYVYILTPRGIIEKSSLAWKFLSYKQNEYEILKKEISLLKDEIDSDSEGRTITMNKKIQNNKE